MTELNLHSLTCLLVYCKAVLPLTFTVYVWMIKSRGNVNARKKREINKMLVRRPRGKISRRNARHKTEHNITTECKGLWSHVVHDGTVYGFYESGTETSNSINGGAILVSQRLSAPHGL